METREDNVDGNTVDRASAKGLTFKCETCGKAFKTSQGLKSHLGRKQNFLCHREANKPPDKENECHSGNTNPQPSTSTSLSEDIRRTFYTKNEKQLAINLFEQHLGEGLQRSKALKEASKHLSIPAIRIQDFCKEKEQTGILVDNDRKRYRSKNMFEKLDDLQRNIIRRTVHDMIRKCREKGANFDDLTYPSLETIHQELSKNAEIPNMSISTLSMVLNCLKFWYTYGQLTFIFLRLLEDSTLVWRYNNKATIHKNHLLIENNNVRNWRRLFLLKVKKLRDSGTPIYYTDETYINENHTTDHFWVDESIQTAKQAAAQGCTTGIHVPLGKGRRVIILDGNESGFVPGARRVWICGKKNDDSDYHSEVTAEIFSDWITKVGDMLPTGSTIILDNASYHNVQSNVPKSSSRKGEYQAYLTERGIKFDKSELKKSLWEKVKVVKKTNPQYDIDLILEQKGINVLRLPPYHPELNCIEMIWSQIKGEVGRRNFTYKINDIKRLTHTVMDGITPERWANCVEHAIKTENKYFQMEGLHNLPPDHLEKRIIIDLDDSSDLESEGEDELRVSCLDFNQNNAVMSSTLETPDHAPTDPSKQQQQQQQQQHEEAKTIQAGPPKFSCQYCSQEFDTRACCSNHEASHKICELCGNSFSGKNASQSLRRHLVLCKRGHRLLEKHDQVTQCNICKKEFATPRNLRRHKQAHSRAPVQCERCEMEFKTKTGLNKHRCPQSIPLVSSDVVMKEVETGEEIAKIHQIPMPRKS